MFKKVTLFLLAALFLFVSCTPVVTPPDIPEDNGADIYLEYNKWGSGDNDYNFQGYGPVVDQNVNFKTGFRCRINISLQSNVDINTLNIYLADTSEAAGWWLELGHCSVYGIQANSPYSSSTHCILTNQPIDVQSVKIVLNASHAAIISDLQFSITTEAINNTDGEVHSLGATYNIVTPLNQDIVDKKLKDTSLTKYGNPSGNPWYCVDASFIYNKLDEESQNILRNYDYVFVDADYLVWYDRTYYGITFTGLNLIVFSNYQEFWYDYSRPEKTLIHEMAHALSREDHTINWANKVVYILKKVFPHVSQNGMQTMVNDIIFRYGYKYENGEVTNR